MIARPRADESGYPRCDFSFEGLEQTSKFAIGVNDIHSLICALAMIGSELDILNREKVRRSVALGRWR